MRFIHVGLGDSDRGDLHETVVPRLDHADPLMGDGPLVAPPPTAPWATPDALPSSTALTPIPVDMSGRTVVVTGATAGIGLEVAHGLAGLGATVVMVGRTLAKAAAAREALAARGADADRLLTAAADLSLTAAVADLGSELAERFPRLDALVNNAGCYPATRVVTAEGFEESWATNVLAYEVLTSRLQHTLRGGRLVYVASSMAGGLDLDDLLWQRRRWSGMHAYRQSKQADRMLAWAWHSRLRPLGVSVNVAHPDGTATNIAHRQRGLYGLVARLAFRTQRPPAEGADTPLWLTASDDLEGVSGGFFVHRAPLDCEWRDDFEACERLWVLTQEQIAPVL